MKRMFVSLLCLVLLATMLIPEMYAQDRRRSGFGRKARTAAIIAGGAAVGGLIGGKKGAAIGAGGSTVYALNRKAARRHFSSRNRKLGTVAGGTLAGAGLGGAIGGKKGAAVGAITGAGGSYVYTQRSRRFRRRY